MKVTATIYELITPDGSHENMGWRWKITYHQGLIIVKDWTYSTRESCRRGMMRVLEAEFGSTFFGVDLELKETTMYNPDFLL